jgi:hypothetical protein
MAPQWDPMVVAGPPGGAIDPGYGYPGQEGDLEGQAQAPQAPGMPGYPAGYPSGYPGGAAPDSVPPGVENAAADVTIGAAGGVAVEGQVPAPSADPADPGYVMGSVTDQEIDTTLAPYGQWVEDEEYGRVWRPDATVVGVDFTPYETCGSWVYTDYGWTFTCDWDWGWLPFHYGQWSWFDWGWGWVADYTWSPAWVEWRSGGGYVGWRPLAPRVRDHRRHVHGHDRGDRGDRGPIVRDHRKQRDSDWRFSHERDFGRTRIRAGLFKNAAEGLRATSVVARPPLRGTRVAAADIMKNRLHGRHGRLGTINGGGRLSGQPVRGTYQPPVRGTYRPPSRGTYQPSTTYQPPSRSWQSSSPTYQPPVRGTYQPPVRGTYQPPSRGTYQPPSRGTYNPPSRGTYQPPSRGTYNPPSRASIGGTYSPPSRTWSRGGSSGGGGRYSPPSRGSYSPPSRASSNSSYSGSRGSSSSSYSGSRGSSSSSYSGSRGSSSSSSSRSSSSSSSSRGSSSSSSSRGGSSSSSSGGGRRR